MFNPRMDPFLQAAIEEARKGLAEGGIPIGSVLVLDGKIIGRGHNQRVQRGSVIHHAEMNCLENAGRLKAVGLSALRPVFHALAVSHVQRRGVALQNPATCGRRKHHVPRPGGLRARSQGVRVEILNDAGCIQLMRDFIAARPELWNEDIGV